MNPNTSPIIFLCGLLLTQTSIAADQTQLPSLLVSSSTPEVEIASLAEGRQALALPGISFVITVQPHCQDEWKPRQLSIGIADTRQTITADRLQEGTPLEIELVIPAKQIAPVVLEGFCTTTEATTDVVTDATTEASTEPEEPASVSTLQIKSLMSAQGSLRCAADDGRESVTYAGHLLDILLVCSNTLENADDTAPAIAE